MATYRAIAAAAEAVIRLLRAGYEPELFDGNELDFRVYRAQDFSGSPMQFGVSLFVYRVMADGTYRTPPGRRSPGGKRQPTQLPLALEFLLTAWAPDASMQNTITGWMMRTLEDTPTLPGALLNAVWPGVFRPDEGIEILLNELSTEDMFHVWDVLTEHGYQLSVPYIARVIHIESLLEEDDEALITERVLHMGDLD